jgi:hypothetical protein
MKLHEFGIRNQRARLRRNGDTVAVGLGWVGGDGIEMADAARCEHNGPCGECPHQWRRARIAARHNAGHAAALCDECFGDLAFEHRD